MQFSNEGLWNIIRQPVFNVFIADIYHILQIQITCYTYTDLVFKYMDQNAS